MSATWHLRGPVVVMLNGEPIAEADRVAFREELSRNSEVVVLPVGYETAFIETSAKVSLTGWLRLLGGLVGRGSPAVREARAVQMARRHGGPTTEQRRKAKRRAQRLARRKQR